MSILYYLLKRYPYGLKGEGWDVDKLCTNPQFPWQYIREHPEGIYSLVGGQLKLVDYNWHRLSTRDNLDWSVIIDFPDKPWNWRYLSAHKHLDWSVIRDLPDKPWEWSYMSRRIDLDCQLVRDLSDKPWDWQYLSIRNNLSWHIIRELPDKSWNWNYLSRRVNLDWWLIRELSNKPWNWDLLSGRRDLDWQLVRDFPDKDWDRSAFNMVDVNEVLANLDAYTTSELSSLILDDQISILMIKSPRKTEKSK